MQNRSFFYEAARAMFLFSLIILGTAIILILFGRLIGGKAPTSPDAISGPRTATYGLVASALGASEPVKPIHGTNLVAVENDGFVYISDTRIDRSPIGFVCGSVQTHGVSVYSGFLYENIAYVTYSPYDIETGLFADTLIGDSIDLKTGEVRTDIAAADLPSAIALLTDNQKYGSDLLPAGVTRLDADWYNALPGPELPVLTSYDCTTATLGALGAALLFFVLFAIAWIFEKVRV